MTAHRSVDTVLLDGFDVDIHEFGVRALREALDPAIAASATEAVLSTAAILATGHDHGGHDPSAIAANVDLLVFALVGLLAGAHCLGMCGPLVTVYADRMGGSSRSDTGRGSSASSSDGTGDGRGASTGVRATTSADSGADGDNGTETSTGQPADASDRPSARGKSTGKRSVLTLYEVRQHGLFNLGRAASYALLGGLMGLIGGLAFTSVGTVTTLGDPIRGALGILVGLAIVASGLYYIRGSPGGAIGISGTTLPLVGPVAAWLTRVLTKRVDRLAGTPGIVGLGAVHGLLPCPIIYPAYLYAFALADPVRGALSLGVLGLGTIPALFAYGTLLGTLDSRTRIRLHRGLGVAFLVLGYLPLQHGLMLYGIHLPHPPVPFYQPL